ncbi:MAG: DUF2264 domain-containing protein [Planctomycetes bacterium]|nr:DUF2264 domain-containing protein [Planctomycetota bacterium]
MPRPIDLDFPTFARNYFARLCHGYERALDDTRVRVWLYGHKNPSDHGGAWDASTRFFPALAAWLADPTRPRALAWRGHTVQLDELAHSILLRAFDPDAPGYWGREEYPRREQRTVESSMLAYGAWLLRDTFLHELPERARECFRDWLEYFGSGDLVRGNWNLFWIVNHAARKALGWPYSQNIIDEAWARIESLDRGDGWMTDGPEAYFDDYNWWVFGTHEQFWMQLDGASDPERVHRIRARIRRRLEDFPSFFGADGSYSEYGRSLSYKFGRLGCAIHALREDDWPHETGMLQRIVRRHLAYYDDQGAVDRRFDTVRQELSEFGHPAVRDGYINTGHPYWCMHAFAALWQIPERHPFWICPEEPIPVERADFRRVVVPAGWIVDGVRQGGHILRYSLGTQHGRGEYAAKYGKFLYGSHFPVDFGSVEGDFGPDSALCLTDGDHWVHPGCYDDFCTAADYLRARYTLQVGIHAISCETILIPRGERCLRLHRLAVPRGAAHLLAVEGGAALGYAPGQAPAKRVDRKALLSLARCGARASLIQGLQGYARAVRAQGFRGNEQLNGVWDRAITPALEARLPAGKATRLVCLTWAAATLPDQFLAPKVKTKWSAKGDVTVTWDGQTLKCAPLPIRD